MSKPKEAPTASNTAHTPSPRQRNTQQKRALANILQHSDHFQSAQDIHMKLRTDGLHVALATVYTQLRLLVEAHEVDTISAPTGETLYRQCDTHLHHHHIMCRYCGKTVEVGGKAVEEWAQTVARAANFMDVSHTVELIGTCATCAKNRICTDTLDTQAGT